MNDHEGFLRALAEDEDDIPTRLVYADWLDEHGEHEEADRQRKWEASKKWLVAFCERHNSARQDPEPYEADITYEYLIDRGKKAVREAESGGYAVILCGSNQTIQEALIQHRREFWRHWAIVTGIPVPEDSVEQIHYSCAC